MTTFAVPASIAALVFDVDGTMYEQRALRLHMAWKLASAHLRSPRAGLATVRMLRAYRTAQERLRGEAVEGRLEEAQLRLAARISGAEKCDVETCVSRWMLDEPLPLLRRYRRPGLLALLDWAKSRGVSVGVLSDYPALEKLRALEVDAYVDLVVTAQDVGVQRFKPDPAGLLATLRQLGISAEQAIYFGDRPDADGEAARRAGVSCVLVGTRTSSGPWLAVRDFLEALDLVQR